jgi:uroporphyrin-III C-methyltransferase
MKAGTVYLVGAGPGDPDLITRKGLRLIQEADVIVFDRLIPFELLDEARPDAELINAGKEPKKQRRSQDDINTILVDRALAGKSVLRLKGGDPFVFGRGSEEALACLAVGVPFEVIPGVSSAIAVPAYAGIPLTHRELSRSFTVLTGHDADGINYEALAQLGGTIVILMGVASLRQICQGLIGAGLAAHCPAAVVEWGTVASQRVIEATVATLPDLAADIQSPAITIIGDVVNLRGEGVRWFDRLLMQDGQHD